MVTDEEDYVGLPERIFAGGGAVTPVWRARSSSMYRNSSASAGLTSGAGSGGFGFNSLLAAARVRWARRSASVSAGGWRNLYLCLLMACR